MTANENKETADRIGPLRDAIDAIDTEIVALINKRLRLGQEIGRIKDASGTAVRDKSRENEIIERLSMINEGPVKETVLHYIFSVIFAASREIQKPQTVAFLGPVSTYTHMAALSHFGHSGNFVPRQYIRDVFSEVERGACQYGVVPVENSIEGAVNRTLDLLFESDLKICAEKYMPISHDLLSRSGNLEEIEVIYSHPQALAQCRAWLRNNVPNATLKESSSTADAAVKATENPRHAAIASSKAALTYNLRVVASKIEDFTKNVTRFLVIGRDEVAPTENDKTTIMFVTAHSPGALFNALGPLSAAGINMVKLESRPIKKERWSYFFVMDIEGHMEDEMLRRSVERMKEYCLHLKWLGSYPKAQEGYQEIEVVS